jgi:glycosyl transferase family 25
MGAPPQALAQGHLAASLVQNSARTRQLIPVYVINLARSPERRAWMEAQLSRAGVEGRFVRAVDGRRFGARCEALRRDGRPRPALSKAEAASTLSHRRAWRQFLASAAEHAVIMEDDVHLGRGFRQILVLDWKRFSFDAVKLETMLYRVWLTRRGEPAAERRLHRLGGEHLGAAAYLISRAGARKMLVATRDVSGCADWSLFGPHTIGDGSVEALQLVPAIAVQDNLWPDAKSRVGLGTTLHEEDRKRLAALARRNKPTGIRRLRREARRVADQLLRWLRLSPTMYRRRVPWE